MTGIGRHKRDPLEGRPSDRLTVIRSGKHDGRSRSLPRACLSGTRLAFQHGQVRDKRSPSGIDRCNRISSRVPASRSSLTGHRLRLPQFRQPATRRGVFCPPARGRRFPRKAIRIPALPKSRRRGPSARHVIYLGTHPVAMMLSMMVYGMIIASYMSVVLLVLIGLHAAHDLAVVAGWLWAAQPLALPD